MQHRIYVNKYIYTVIARYSGLNLLFKSRNMKLGIIDGGQGDIRDNSGNV
jgi:hypothetical protein